MKKTDPATTVTVTLTRDSVCMADDVDAPHAETFSVDATASLRDLVELVAASDYLPFPSDAWGWTIATHDVVVAIRPRALVGRWVEELVGDPARVAASQTPSLTASYVRPESPVRQMGMPVRRVDGWMLYLFFAVIALALFAWWRSSG